MLNKVLRVTIVMLLFAAPFVQTTRADGSGLPPVDAGGGTVAVGVFIAAAVGVEALRRRRNAGRS